MEEIFKLSESWSEVKPKSELVIYGIGRIGRRVLPTLMKEFKISFIVDKTVKEKDIFGIEVLRLSEAVERLRTENKKIIVTTVLAAYKDIAQELECKGFKEFVDFCHFERFAGEWNLRWQNRCVVSKIDTIITSKCTLRCRNCNMFIGYVDKPVDMDFNSLKRNFDIFFDSVDFVYEYTLLGGEPFLHKNLDDIIEYLRTHYGERIGQINLISNGTVLPNEKIKTVLAQNHVAIHISDYTGTLKYNGKLQKVVDSLAQAGIEYYVIPNNTWKDVVYPKEDYHTDNPREHMLTCGHSTHSVDNGRLYWCDPAFGAEYFTGFKSQDDDSLDLEQNKNKYSKYQASLNILGYLLGHVNERGYMTFCKRCAGVGIDNDRVVKAGVQMKG